MEQKRLLLEKTIGKTCAYIPDNINEYFKLTELLGSGAHGEVYSAYVTRKGTKLLGKKLTM